MAQVGRLVGAIVATTGDELYLIGDCKGPCDFNLYGLVTPAVRNVLQQPYIRLQKQGEVRLEEPFLSIDREGEALAQLLVDVFMIFRNGSISERLWRLTLSHCQQRSDGLWDADWLQKVPGGIWDIVRDTVLRC